MKIKDTFQKKENNEKSGVDIIKYIPSSSEKKQAIMMYFFFGIVAGLSKKEMSVFSYYHLKQSSGWWILFIGTIILDMVLLFLPVIKYLGFIPLLLLVIVWILNMKNAWDGKYFVAKHEGVLSLFSGVGGRFIDLFDIKIDTKSISQSDDVQIPNQTQTSLQDLQIDSRLTQDKNVDTMPDSLSGSDIEKDIQTKQ